MGCRPSTGGPPGPPFPQQPASCCTAAAVAAGTDGPRRATAAKRPQGSRGDEGLLPFKLELKGSDERGEAKENETETPRTMTETQTPGPPRCPCCCWCCWCKGWHKRHRKEKGQKGRGPAPAPLEGRRTTLSAWRLEGVPRCVA